MELVTNKTTETEFKIKSSLKIKEILLDSKSKYSPKDKKLQRKSKKLKSKNKCSFQSETHLSNLFQNQQWTIINVKEPPSNNSNTSKHTSVKSKSKESCKSNKTEEFNCFKCNNKSTDRINRDKKEKA